VFITDEKTKAPPARSAEHTRAARALPVPELPRMRSPACALQDAESSLTEQLRPLVEGAGGTGEAPPAGSFSESANQVNTVLLTYRKG
jgi:hypothetical protein